MKQTKITKEEMNVIIFIRAGRKAGYRVDISLSEKTRTKRLIGLPTALYRFIYSQLFQ